MFLEKCESLVELRKKNWLNRRKKKNTTIIKSESFKVIYFAFKIDYQV